MSAARGVTRSARRRNTPSPAKAMRVPERPPGTVMQRLSTASCRTSRPPPAPSAPRRVNSCDRRSCRARVRFVKFAAAMRSENPDAASSVNRMGRAWPVSSRKQLGGGDPQRIGWPIRRGIRVVQAPRDGGHLGAGGGYIGSGANPSEGLHHAHVSHVHHSRVGPERTRPRRHPDVVVVGIGGQRGKKHADDVVDLVVHRERPPTTAGSPPGAPASSDSSAPPPAARRSRPRPGVKRRPSSGRTPRRSKKTSDTTPVWTRCGLAPAIQLERHRVVLGHPVECPGAAEVARPRPPRSRRRCRAFLLRAAGHPDHPVARWGRGGRASSTPFTMLNTAVLAPVPNAMVRRASAV